MISGSQRHLFEIPDGVAFLNCAYMSPNLRAVREAGQAAVARKSRPWEITAPDFFTSSDRARDLFARLVGGEPEGVALVPSVSYGIGVAATNLPVAAGQRIVVLAEQFPSNVYPWRELAARRDAVVHTVPRPADGDWTAAVVGAVDQRTAVVAVPNVHWTDGTCVDLVAVGRAARVAGAALVVDATQSLGAHPLDVAAVQPDFLVNAAYKWLLGPYSLAFLYAAPHRREGAPLEHNWITRAGSEDFAGLVDYIDSFQRGAVRYDAGERSNFALMPMAIAALTQILEWGVAGIAGYAGSLTGRVERETAALGLSPVPAGSRAAHLMGVRFPGGVPVDLVARLAAAGVHVSVRGDSVRVSAHVFNTDADVDRLLEVLAA